MMRISSSVEYGMRVMVQLARGRDRGPVSAETLSGAENVPKDYVEQILRRLRQAGLIASVRGPSGGYALSRPPKDIKVGDVIRALEHTVFEDVCERYAEGEQDCHHQGMCGLRPVWKRLGAMIEGFLDSVSLDQILEEEETVVAQLFKGPIAAKGKE